MSFHMKNAKARRALQAASVPLFAALATVEHMETHLRAEILSIDGQDRVRDQAVFPMRDCDTGATLAKAMLARAPESIRKLFQNA